MALGRRNRQQQEAWVATTELPKSPGHPFYRQLNQLLAEAEFDSWLEILCRPHYAEERGRPSIPPGVYFRMVRIGSQRGIAWRCSDSRSLAEFLGTPITEETPDHSSMSRVHQRLPLEIHEQVFGFVLQLAADNDLVSGKKVAVDSTTLEANAAMKSIVRKDTGEDYTASLRKLAADAGLEDPTDEELRRFDKQRKVKKPAWILLPSPVCSRGTPRQPPLTSKRWPGWGIRYAIYNFDISECFNGNWEDRYSGAWWAAGWGTTGTAYSTPTWGDYSGYWGDSSGYASQPVYYDYGSNVVYQADSVYVNGDAVGTQEEYAQQASPTRANKLRPPRKKNGCRSRFARVPVSQDGRGAGCEMCGWSVHVSGLRILPWDGCQAEAAAEIVGGGVEWQVGGGGPEVELVAASVAAKTVEQVALRFYGERVILLRAA